MSLLWLLDVWGVIIENPDCFYKFGFIVLQASLLWHLIYSKVMLKAMHRMFRFFTGFLVALVLCINPGLASAECEHGFHL